MSCYCCDYYSLGGAPISRDFEKAHPRGVSQAARRYVIILGKLEDISENMKGTFHRCGGTWTSPAYGRQCCNKPSWKDECVKWNALSKLYCSLSLMFPAIAQGLSPFFNPRPFVACGKDLMAFCYQNSFAADSFLQMPELTWEDTNCNRLLWGSRRESNQSRT